MASKKDKSDFRIYPALSRRFRHYVDIVGHARAFMQMLASQDDEGLARIMEQTDPREDLYAVVVKEGPNGGITQDAHAVHLAQALLRFGDERLCDAWLLPSLLNGHDKGMMLGESLLLQRYDWFDRVRGCITKEDHEALSCGNGDFSPLFYWAASPPPAGQEGVYGAALDALLALPPYENRRNKVIDGLERAFRWAVEEENIVALDQLKDRGWVVSLANVCAATQGALPASLQWLLQHGGQEVLTARVEAGELDAQSWAMELRKAARNETPGERDFERIVEVMHQLMRVPGLGALMGPHLLLDESEDRWNIECNAALLDQQVPKATAQPRSPRF